MFSGKLGKLTRIFFAFVLCVSMVPLTTFSADADAAPAEDGGGAALATEIPAASGIDHIHNAPGWTCTERIDLACDIPEHVHSVEGGCYAASDDPICGMEEGEGAHIHDDGCYVTEFVCGEGEAEEHEHGPECESRVLACEQEEGPGHVHDPFGCFHELTCAAQEHIHEAPCYVSSMECETEFKLLTVEHFIAVNGQRIRAGETYQMLLRPDAPYSVALLDLAESGYRYTSNEGVRQSAEEAPEPFIADVVERDGGLKLQGQMEGGDVLIIVDYGYINPNAPYQGNYLGSNASGGDETLIYSFIGQGVKDTQAELDVDVDGMVQTLWDALESDEVKRLPLSGSRFLEPLKQQVSLEYGPNLIYDEEAGGDEVLFHDISPLLEHIAGGAERLDTLTRVDIKQYLANVIRHVYGFDHDRGSVDDNKVQVTADCKAQKNFYYREGEKQSINFITGAASATVIGIPQTKFPPVPDDDGVIIDYDVLLEENRIIACSTVDVSPYTQNVSAQSENYAFIGWHFDPSFGVIDDYTEDNKIKKYKDLKVYTTEELGHVLTHMPASGTNCYAVWNAVASDYVVQVWFESPDEEGTYVESHSLDMKRKASIGDDLTCDQFDADRADETLVVQAANGEGAFPVTFADNEEGGSGHSDIYYDWAAYESSPFYGFDLLGKDHEDHECPKKLVDQNGNESKTTGNLCNCRSVTLGETGETVLNVFYTREMWEIAIHPDVELYQYKERSDKGQGYDFVYAVGGRFQDEFTADLKANADKDEIILRGKYGMAVSAEDAHASEQWSDLFSGEAALVGEAHAPEEGAYPASYVIPAGQEVPFTQMVNWSASESLSACSTKAYDHDIVMGYKGLSAASPSIFTASYHYKEDGTKGREIETSSILWTSDAFDGCNTADMAADGTPFVYGTHRLDLYPHYSNLDTEGQGEMSFNIDYYVQALPSDASDGKAIHTYDGSVDFVKYGVDDDSQHTISFSQYADTLKYDVQVPAGFTALMWRVAADSITRNDGAGFYGFTGNKITSAATKHNNAIQAHLSDCGRCGQIPIRYIQFDGTATYSNHNGGFNDENVVYQNGNSVYLSDWKIWNTWHKATCTRKIAITDPNGYFDVSPYWIADWVRTPAGTAKLDGTIEGYEKLVQDADAGDVDSIRLLAQLRSSVMIGNLYPANMEYVNTPYTLHVFRHSGGTEQPNAVNSVAFARNAYNITYNTCYVDSDGELIRDENGIKHDVVHRTGENEDDPAVRFDQPLGVDPQSGEALYAGYSNYYDARFTYDSVNGFTFAGYDASSPFVEVTDALPVMAAMLASGEDAVVPRYEGGYGKWYLDPDGTIEFNEENLAKMPAGDVDVYYHFNASHNDVYFIDEVTGVGEYADVDINGTRMDLAHVLDHQMVSPNGHAAPISAPVDNDNRFVGWFYDKEGKRPFDFDAEITEDVIVYAVWMPKEPTEYTINHILVNVDGSEEILQSTHEEGLVGNTVDAQALESEHYHDGMFFEPDYYSASMVLAKDKEDNVLEFRYRYAGRSYTVEYLDVDTGRPIVPDAGTTTKLSVVTNKYQDIPGWELVSDPYITTILKPKGDTVIQFWYRRAQDPESPDGPDPHATRVDVNAMKVLDGVMPEGERFTFSLSDAEGNVVQTVHAMDGDIAFDELSFSEAGSRAYILKEEDEGDPAIRYDEAVYEIAVDVRSDDEGMLMADVSILRNGELYDGTPVFRNTSAALGLPQTGDGLARIVLLLLSVAGAALLAMCAARRKMARRR